jgi:hypothetical protein
MQMSKKLQAVLTIGYKNFAMSAEDGAKVLNILATARRIDDAYDGEGARRSPPKPTSYWYEVGVDDNDELKLRVMALEIEPARRERYVEPESPTDI